MHHQDQLLLKSIFDCAGRNERTAAEMRAKAERAKALADEENAKKARLMESYAAILTPPSFGFKDTKLALDAAEFSIAVDDKLQKFSQKYPESKLNSQAVAEKFTALNQELHATYLGVQQKVQPNKEELKARFAGLHEALDDVVKKIPNVEVKAGSDEKTKEAADLKTFIEKKQQELKEMEQKTFNEQLEVLKKDMDDLRNKYREKMRALELGYSTAKELPVELFDITKPEDLKLTTPAFGVIAGNDNEEKEYQKRLNAITGKGTKFLKYESDPDNLIYISDQTGTRPSVPVHSQIARNKDWNPLKGKWNPFKTDYSLFDKAMSECINITLIQNAKEGKGRSFGLNYDTPDDFDLKEFMHLMDVVKARNNEDLAKMNPKEPGIPPLLDLPRKYAEFDEKSITDILKKLATKGTGPESDFMKVRAKINEVNRLAEQAKKREAELQAQYGTGDQAEIKQRARITEVKQMISELNTKPILDNPTLETILGLEAKVDESKRSVLVDEAEPDNAAEVKLDVPEQKREAIDLTKPEVVEKVKEQIQQLEDRIQKLGQACDVINSQDYKKGTTLASELDNLSARVSAEIKYLNTSGGRILKAIENKPEYKEQSSRFDTIADNLTKLNRDIESHQERFKAIKEGREPEKAQTRRM